MSAKHTHPWVDGQGRPLEPTSIDPKTGHRFPGRLEPIVCTQAAAARAIGVSRSRVKQLVTAGHLRMTLAYGRMYVLVSSLDGHLARRNRRKEHGK